MYFLVLMEFLHVCTHLCGSLVRPGALELRQMFQDECGVLEVQSFQDVGKRPVKGSQNWLVFCYMLLCLM